MARLLGIDYGARRVGLAICDPEGRLASPLKTLDTPKNPAALVRLVLTEGRAWNVAGFVVGLPLNMDGSEGPQAKKTRAFGALLAQTSGMPVHYWDERLSSHVAQDALDASGLSRERKKARLDPVAAALILQGYLDAQPAGSLGRAPPADGPAAAPD